MSINLACDGCGHGIADEKDAFEEGYASPKTHYCKKCHKIWFDFEEEVRRRIENDAAEFEAWFDTKKKHFKQEHQFIKLPDE